METTGIGLREAAERAYAQALAEMEAREQEREAGDRLRRQERLHGQLESWLGIHSRGGLDDEQCVTVDGLRFALGHQDRLVLAAECRECGAFIHSAPLYGLPDLGRLLADPEWQVCRYGHCPADEGPALVAPESLLLRENRRQVAVEQQLLAAMEAFLDRWLAAKMSGDE